MIETESARELKVIIRFLFEAKEIQTLEKPFSVKESANETDESKTIDETITEFLDDVQKTAIENGYVISKEVIVQTTITLILYLIKHDVEEKTIDVELTKPEVKENGDKTDS